MMRYRLTYGLLYYKNNTKMNHRATFQSIHINNAHMSFRFYLKRLTYGLLYYKNNTKMNHGATFHSIHTCRRIFFCSNDFLVLNEKIDVWAFIL